MAKKESKRQKTAREAAAATKTRNKRNADALKMAMGALGVKKKVIKKKRK